MPNRRIIWKKNILSKIKMMNFRHQIMADFIIKMLCKKLMKFLKKMLGIIYIIIDRVKKKGR